MIVSDNYFFGAGGSDLDYYDPNTLAFIQRLPVATQGYVSGLGGDGLGGAPKDDWYSINVAAGNQLYLQTSLRPIKAASSPTRLRSRSSLYDTYGNLVAIGTKLADGRNEALFFNAPVSGQYYHRRSPTIRAAPASTTSRSTPRRTSLAASPARSTTTSTAAAASSPATPACTTGKSISTTRATTSSPRS